MTRIDRRYLSNLDWVSLLLVILISVVGLVTLFSATVGCSQDLVGFFSKQVWGTLLSLGIYLFFCLSDYHTLERWGYFFFYILIGILIFTLIKGSIGMGAQRWFGFAGFKFQPSELTKLFLPPFFTYLLATEKRRPFGTGIFFLLLTFLGAVCLLILKQPDLGTAIIVASSGVAILWATGFPKKIFIGLFLLACLGIPLGWSALKPYQKNRVIVFLGGGDNQKERYQVEQSKIAIGSGGLWGKGFLHGTQNRYCFLPERRTDSIFAVFAEQFGLIGSLFLLMLYALLFWRIYRLIPSIPSPHEQLLAFGLVTPIALSALINIAMVLGLAPIVGIPLPFMSYGLSHTTTSYAALGWINGIFSRRFRMRK